MKKFLFVICTIGIGGYFSEAKAQYDLTEPPNYDRFVGKPFSEVVYKGRLVYKKIKDMEGVEELEYRRSDGCILIFGVRKNDDFIQYWRIDSGPGTCYESKQSLNR